MNQNDIVEEWIARQRTLGAKINGPDGVDNHLHFIEGYVTLSTLVAKAHQAGKEAQREEINTYIEEAIFNLHASGSDNLDFLNALMNMQMLLTPTTPPDGASKEKEV
jgi:hypothetical protein